jgi:hypothetical protein
MICPPEGHHQYHQPPVSSETSRWRIGARNVKACCESEAKLKNTVPLCSDNSTNHFTLRCVPTSELEKGGALASGRAPPLTPVAHARLTHALSHASIEIEIEGETRMPPASATVNRRCPSRSKNKLTRAFGRRASVIAPLPRLSLLAGPVF